jgi:hypothetical protein
MHGACVFENKEQYDKANKILTVVLQNALEKYFCIYLQTMLQSDQSFGQREITCRVSPSIQ